MSEPSNSMSSLAHSLLGELGVRVIAPQAAVNLTLEGGDFVLCTAYDPELIRLLRAVPGRRWDGRSNIIPGTAEAAGYLRIIVERFALTVTPEVAGRLRDGINVPVGPATWSSGLNYTPGEGFVLRAPYDRELIQAHRSVPGRRYDRGVNYFPDTAESCSRLRLIVEHFGLRASPEARTRIETASLGDIARRQASRATDAEIPIDLGAPYALYPFQRGAVAYGLQVRRAILGLEMGLGKGPCSQAIVETVDGFPCIVVCPAVMRLVWVDEIAKFFPHRKVAVVMGTKSGQMPTADYVIVSYSVLADRLDDLLSIAPRALILDESQLIKNAGTQKKPVQRTRAALALSEAVPADGTVLLLTGTPVTNRPLELLTQINALGQINAFGGAKGFKETYCKKVVNALSQWDYSGAAKIHELHEKLRATCLPGSARVLTESGYRRIDDIVQSGFAGRVLGWSPTLGWRWAPVVQRTSRTADRLLALHAGSHRLVCTPDHRVWVEERGWARADEIRVGDTLRHVRRPRLDQDDVALPAVLPRWCPPGASGRHLPNVRRAVPAGQTRAEGVLEAVHPTQRSGYLPMVQERLPSEAGTALLLARVLQLGDLPLGGSSQLPDRSEERGRPSPPPASTEAVQGLVRPDQPTAASITTPPRMGSLPVRMVDLLRGAVLAGGLGRSRQPPRHRGRRIDAQAPRPASTRSAQGVATESGRVDRIEVLECGRGTPPGHGCGDGGRLVPVYDIAVADVHSFVADGFLVHNCFYRVTKKDVLPELPSVDHQPSRLPCETEAMKVYRRAEADIIRRMGEKAAAIALELGEDPDGAAVAARIRARAAEELIKVGELRQLAVAAKMDSVVEWVRGFLADSEEKIILFAEHRAVVERLATTFGAERIWGGQPDPQRMAAVKTFQEDPDCRVIVCSTPAAGVGITLTAASHVAFIELAWTPAAIDQAIARAYGRLSDLHGVVVHYLLAAECDIEMDMTDLLDRKRITIDAVTDGKHAEEVTVLGELLVRMARRGLGLA